MECNMKTREGTDRRDRERSRRGGPSRLCIALQLKKGQTRVVEVRSVHVIHCAFCGFIIRLLKFAGLMPSMGVEHKDQQRELLPKSIRPVHYELTLTPNLEACTFEGICSIDVEVVEPTNKVIVNARELKINSLQISHDIPVSSIDLNTNNDWLTATFAEELPKGPATIVFNYSAILNDKMAGFYASKYERDGVQKTMAVTQFEACDCRRALPCWDEPAVKATFGVSLIVDEKLTAVSNMPERQCVPIGNGLVKRQFDRSPIMSTYLLAFIVGEFDYCETISEDGVKIRVYTPIGSKIQGQFALDVSVKTLDFYNKYFEIKYPLPKLDLLAIPDFAAGAMENWGCVTYRSTALLVDPQNSSASTKQYVALVVAHELAHQWFGNLVTMEWWTDLWLNEGFASWVEYLAVDHLFPEWKMWTQFVSHDFGSALSLDALQNSHPVEVPVYKATEVDEIFDNISYCKGGSVIRMLVKYMGEEEFRKGMVLYLNRHAYGNASTNDLWNALSESSKKPISTVMEKWTRTQGFPVVSVDYDSANPANLILKQDRFLVTGSSKEYSSQLWPIPITAVTNNSAPSSIVLFCDKSQSLPIGAPGASYIKLNAGQCGVYRVLYSTSMFEKIQNAIKSGLIVDPADRLGIQNDAIALSCAGLLKTNQVLQLLLSYVKESNYTVWNDIMIHTVSDLKGLLMMHEDLYSKFKLFVQELLEPVANSVGWEPKPTDDHLTAMLRSLVIPKLGINGHASTIAEACKRFDAFVASKFQTGLVPDLRSGVYSIALAKRGASVYNILINFYKQSTHQEEKVRILSSLGSAEDPALLQKALDFCFSPDVRKQDIMYIVRSISANPKGVSLAWMWLKNNYQKIADNFGSGPTFSRLISYATGNFTTREMANEISTFFKAHPHVGAERTVKQSLEHIESMALWMDRDYAALKEWLCSRYH